MNNNFLQKGFFPIILGLIVVIIVVGGVLVRQQGWLTEKEMETDIPDKSGENEKVATLYTDKNEYILGESITVTLKNGLITPIHFRSACYSNRPVMDLERYESGHWEKVPETAPFWSCKVDLSCVSVEIGEEITLRSVGLTDEKHVLLPARYRYSTQIFVFSEEEQPETSLPLKNIAQAAGYSCDGRPVRWPDDYVTIYSNEFTVKDNPSLLKNLQGTIIKKECIELSNYYPLGLETQDGITYKIIGPKELELEQKQNKKVLISGYITGRVFDGPQYLDCYNNSIYALSFSDSH